jgi:hypothetical protein
MIKSLELRWFFKDILPINIYQWFENILPGNEKFEEEPRSDYYLIPQSEDLGVKLSRQQLQIKVRKDYVNFSLKNNNNIQGILEHWTRYSWNSLYTTENKKIDTFYDRFSYIKVDKKRLIRKYKISDDMLIQIPISNIIDTKCSIEITKINVKEQIWSTLAFDWFLDNNKNDTTISIDHITNKKIFNKTIKVLFDQYPDDRITKKINSFSYPCFLSKLSK